MAKKALSSKYVVLRRFCCLLWTVGVVASLACVFVLWPWDPELRIERMNVKRVKVHPIPPVSADVWISLSVRVHNRAMYWMELTDVDVGVKYRGRKMGHVESEGWHVRGWASTNVDGVLQFSGLPSSEVVHLLEDLAMGKVYFHTVIEVYGQLGFLLFRIPHLFKVEQNFFGRIFLEGFLVRVFQISATPSSDSNCIGLLFNSFPSEHFIYFSKNEVLAKH